MVDHIGGSGNFGSELMEFFSAPIDALFDWPNCALCEASEHHTVVIEHFAKVPLQIVQCGVCGFCYSLPQPTDYLMGLMHSRESRNAMVDAGILPEARRMKSATIFDYTKQSHMHGVYQKGLEEISARVSGGVLLDVGCAGGYFVQMASEAGYDAIGVDMPSATLREGRQRLHLDLRECSPNELPTDLPSCDVVTLWNVLEHIPRPVDYLQKISKVLKTGGLLLVDVPNFAFRLAQRRLIGVSRPTSQRFMPQDHLNHFTQTTLRKMLIATGFREVSFGVAHDDGAKGITAVTRRTIMRIAFQASGGRINWQHPLSCIARS